MRHPITDHRLCTQLLTSIAIALSTAACSDHETLEQARHDCRQYMEMATELNECEHRACRQAVLDSLAGHKDGLAHALKFVATDAYVTDFQTCVAVAAGQR